MSDWYRLHCICPGCGLGKECDWYHKEEACCSSNGWLYINSSCNIKCDECYNRNLKSPSFVLGWEFMCERHNGEYKKADEITVCNAISCVRTNNNVPKEVRKQMINILNNY
jgi:hypothetical protein